MIEQAIHAMKHSPRHNYVIPGLTSWLIGTPHPKKGCVRLFTMDRFHEEPIIPHSHRFDFVCRVLKGKVLNRIWSPSAMGDLYMRSNVTYEGELGKHRQERLDQGNYRHDDYVFKEGQEYGMRAEQFHSIFFDKYTEVLFFEGPNRLELSQVLEPVSQGQVVPLFKTEPWMFLKGDENV